MKTQILTALIFVLALPLCAHASEQSDLLKVKALAQKKVSGSDVRIVTTVFKNEDGNPCAAEGTSYIAEIQLRKSERALDKNGEPTEVRKWQKFNEYSISQRDLHKGLDLGDSVCME